VIKRERFAGALFIVFKSPNMGGTISGNPLGSASTDSPGGATPDGPNPMKLSRRGYNGTSCRLQSMLSVSAS